MARKAIKEVRGLSIFLQGISLILPDSIVLQILLGPIALLFQGFPTSAPETLTLTRPKQDDDSRKPS